MPIRSAFIVFALVLLAPVAAAQSLVELRFSGVLSSSTRVEVEVGAQIKGADRRLDVHAFLAKGTSGADLAALVAGRLTSSGFQVHLGSPNGTGQARALFVEKVLFVNLRLGEGLRGSVTVCDAVPLALRVLPAAKEGRALTLSVTAGTYNPATKVHGTQELTVELEAGSHMARNSEVLMKAATAAKWVTDRPRADLWRPVRMGGGSRFTGFSVEVSGGWRVEFDLVEA